MRVVMKETMKGSPNGIRVLTFEANKEYDMPESLGAVFIKGGWAKEVKPEPKKPEGKKPPENKSVAGASENKAEGDHKPEGAGQ